MTTVSTSDYPARLSIDYPDRELDRLSTAIRIIYVIPVTIVLLFLGGSNAGVGVGGLLFMPIALMLLFRKKYPRWWFDFALGVARFSARVTAYLLLMSDEYPSTDEDQFVDLEIDYPDATHLNRWMPLVKWFLAIPHFIVLAFLAAGAVIATVWAWFAILFTGRYPRAAFDFIEGVMRWGLRVEAYALLLVTDEYPPFELR